MKHNTIRKVWVAALLLLLVMVPFSMARDGSDDYDDAYDDSDYRRNDDSRSLSGSSGSSSELKHIERASINLQVLRTSAEKLQSTQGFTYKEVVTFLDYAEDHLVKAKQYLSLGDERSAKRSLDLAEENIRSADRMVKRFLPDDSNWGSLSSSNGAAFPVQLDRAITATQSLKLEIEEVMKMIESGKLDAATYGPFYRKIYALTNSALDAFQSAKRYYAVGDMAMAREQYTNGLKNLQDVNAALRSDSAVGGSTSASKIRSAVALVASAGSYEPVRLVRNELTASLEAFKKTKSLDNGKDLCGAFVSTEIATVEKAIAHLDNVKDADAIAKLSAYKVSLQQSMEKCAVASDVTSLRAISVEAKQYNDAAVIARMNLVENVLSRYVQITQDTMVRVDRLKSVTDDPTTLATLDAAQSSLKMASASFADAKISLSAGDSAKARIQVASGREYLLKGLRQLRSVVHDARDEAGLRGDGTVDDNPSMARQTVSARSVRQADPAVAVN